MTNPTSPIPWAPAFAVAARSATMKIVRPARFAGTLLAILLASTTAAAAQDCEIRYRAGVSSTEITSTVAHDQTTAINASNVKYVRILQGARPADVVVTNAIPFTGNKTVSLTANYRRDPPIGDYPNAITLYSMSCPEDGGFGTAQAMASGLQTVGTSLNDIASAIHTAFGVGGQEMVNILNAISNDATAIAGPVKSTFNASNEQVALWLKGAGFDVNQIATALRDAFNVSGTQLTQVLKVIESDAVLVAEALQGVFTAMSRTQLAGWLMGAGFGASQTAEALASVLGATGAQIAANLRALDVPVLAAAAALQSALSAGAADVTAWLQQAGYAAGEIAAALQGTFNAGGAQVAELLRGAGFGAEQVAAALVSAFNAGGTQVAQWMFSAGFTLDQTMAALLGAFGELGDQIVAWMTQAGYLFEDTLATVLTVVMIPLQSAMQLTEDFVEGAPAQREELLVRVGYARDAIASVVINIASVGHGFRMGGDGWPPDQEMSLYPDLTGLTFTGTGLMVVDGVTGLPPGTQTEIVERGVRNPTTHYLYVRITLPRNLAIGSSGTGTLTVPGAAGPTFLWTVRERPVRPETGWRGGAPSAALVALPVENQYRLQSGTTMDAAGTVFTGLNPLQGSPFCRAPITGAADIPEGGTARNNQLTSNEQMIAVPDLVWGVRNAGTTATTGPFDVVLRLGTLEVARQTVQGLGPGLDQTFTYQRPQSQTTVARVGPGDVCYHRGLPGSGWSDDPGYNVIVESP